MVLIEKEGIPAVCIVGSLLQRVAANVYRGAKFADLPLAVVPQDALTRAIADYRPVFEQSLDSIVFGLTAWRPQSQATGISPATPATFVYQGQDYADAMQQMNEAFLTNRWGDGLPLLPATKERVRWLLTGTDRAPDEMVAKVPPRGGIATPAAIAIVAAMAGCRPEYMPVLIAIVEAMADPRFQLAESSGTTHASTPTVVINGPIAKQIGINSSYGMLGPSAEYPAGASIGRAIRLLLTTLGGVIPGVTSVSVMAQPGRYT
ncbi:MAG TPA: hypothetical protein PLB78_18215, partial [Anaerolineae bacterium]|nr:hypothetical protein [Anaerolineae bacterium]